MTPNNGLFDALVGLTPGFRDILQQARTAAATDVSLLIVGESGTGKDLLAQALQRCSGRSKKPFVTLNCAAIPAGLAESELFGHRKGSFTGADSDGAGRLLAAHGGTLFLDEIDSLPLEVQPKLLRFLECGEIQPIGETLHRKVDVRIIAASNANLAMRVRAGLFREDLYYRLNVFPVAIPPLRERPDDIPLLLIHYVREFSKHHRLPEISFSPDAFAWLTKYPWPGNVRELKNVCERLSILRAGREIGVSDLPAEIGRILGLGPNPDPKVARHIPALARRLDRTKFQMN